MREPDKKSHGRKTPIDPVDIHVGARLRKRRALAGLSQQQLGAGIGVTFQQVQKYESGANRMSAGRLYRIASLLDIPVSYFFDGLEQQEKPREPQISEDMMNSRETLALLRAYYAVPDKKQRDAVISILKMMAAD